MMDNKAVLREHAESHFINLKCNMDVIIIISLFISAKLSLATPVPKYCVWFLDVQFMINSRETAR
jgi:hypothetical protein